MIKKVFPIILIVLQSLAGAVCLYEKDFKMMIYWFAAAVLNAAVTF